MSSLNEYSSVPGPLTITLSSNFMASTAYDLTNFQNEYGQGNGGVFGARASGSWGPKMNNQAVTDWTGKSQNMTPQPNNISDFF